MASEPKALRYVDIGINLTDSMYQGIYHGKKHHESDLEDVIQRGVDAGCKKFMVTGSDLEESKAAVELAKAHPGLCYATVGVHPCSASTFTSHPSGPSALLSALQSLALSAKSSSHASAFGEIGLDYDRLHHADRETQLTYFAAQLDVAVHVQLPLFLHSRAAAADFARLLRQRADELPKRGLVHSFTGTLDEMQELVAMGYDIGVNGCSMKSEENVEVVRQIPLERLQLETDGPWCEMRPSHASAEYLREGAPPPLPAAVKKEKWVEGCTVKGRNEPGSIGRVAWAVAGIKGLGVDEVAEAAWRNSIKMFGLGEEVPQ